MGKWTHENFITYNSQGYLIFSSTLARYIRDQYGNPTSALIDVNENERVIRITFNRNGIGYCVSNNGTGAGAKTSLGRTQKDIGLECKRYSDLDYGNDYIDMRY